MIGDGGISCYHNRIDSNDLEKAKKLGLNISQVCRNALKDAIRRLETPNPLNITSEGGLGTAGSEWAGPDLNRRSSPCEGDVITTLDHRP